MAEGPSYLSRTPRASELAKRFGMTPEAMEELLQQTHSEYAGALLPPVEPKAETPIEQAAKSVPTFPETLPDTPQGKHPTAQPISGGFIAAIFVVLLIGLGIALSFRQGCFHRRGEQTSAKPVDTVQSMMHHAAAQASTPPQPITNTSPSEVPPESLVVPQEEPPGVTGPPTNSGITTEAQALRAEKQPVPKPLLITASNFDAEETLAKLHAEGNRRAYMRAVHSTHGVTYRIYARP